MGQSTDLLRILTFFRVEQKPRLKSLLFLRAVYPETHDSTIEED